MSRLGKQSKSKLRPKGAMIVGRIREQFTCVSSGCRWPNNGLKPSMPWMARARRRAFHTKTKRVIARARHEERTDNEVIMV